MQRLKGKAAIVTGGAQGIGEAIARRLAKEGAPTYSGADGNAYSNPRTPWTAHLPTCTVLFIERLFSALIEICAGYPPACLGLSACGQAQAGGSPQDEARAFA